MVPVACAALLVGSMSTSSALDFLGFGKKNKLDRAPTATELAAQEKSAVAMIGNARAMESKGRRGSAISIYRKVVKLYPLTDAAPEAQFSLAGLRQMSDIDDAFKDYQKLIDNYRQSSQFGKAIEQQFSIAEEARETGGGRGFLGLTKKIGEKRVIEMFELVKRNAPFSSTAPKAQFAVGELHQERGEIDELVAAFQAVVDEYPDHPLAAEAQRRMGNARFYLSQDSNNPTTSEKARDDLQQYIERFPDASEVDEAREHMTLLEEQEVEKSLEVAAFYEKQGKLTAAAIYYKDVMKYPESPNYAKAQERLAALGREDATLLLNTPGVAASAMNNGRRITRVPARINVKDRPNFNGPPSPVMRRPKMRTGTPIPVAPAVDDIPEAIPVDKAGTPLRRRPGGEQPLLDTPLDKPLPTPKGIDPEIITESGELPDPSGLIPGDAEDAKKKAADLVEKLKKKLEEDDGSQPSTKADDTPEDSGTKEEPEKSGE